MTINQLRNLTPEILIVGSYPAIIQSILDYDYLNDRLAPTIKGIIAAGRKFEKYFWGDQEILIPIYTTSQELPEQLKKEINLFVNLSSGRRTLASTLDILTTCPNIIAADLFAEEVTEKAALEIYERLLTRSKENKPLIVGPASVGLIIPGQFKLGAIGGVQARQLVEADLFTPGSVAVFSASGGMTNELINILAKQKINLSFALSFGGDRFPVMPPQEAFLLAENDPNTKAILYYGELGGDDEYEIVKLKESGQISKPIVAYIAGSISELFAQPTQFGHAKAMAKTAEESAVAKRIAIRTIGAIVPDSFTEFIAAAKQLQKYNDVPNENSENDFELKLQTIEHRHAKLFTSSLSGEVAGDVQILGENILDFAHNNSLGGVIAKILLGKREISPEMASFTDLVMKLLVDHGPYQSGAVNTMITARAGKDLVSALASGLLTIGPRFGGAINDAAQLLVTGVEKHLSAYDLVEEYAQRREYLPGIGHRKYKIDNPDPRVTEILGYVSTLNLKTYSNFALAIQKITTAKKANLILNVDGTIAACLLDLLVEKEGYSVYDLKELIEVEFFNAFFVLSRAIGFTGHYLDQRRMDEGLFRLDENYVTNL